MRKFILFLILFSCFISLNKSNVFAKEVINEDVVMNYNDLTDNVSIINKNYFSFERNEKIYIYDKVKKHFITDGTLIKSVYNNNYAFLLVNYNNNYYIYSYNFSNALVNGKEFIDINVLDINIFNNTLVIVGKKDDDAYIGYYKDNLTLQKDTTYGGESYEEFNLIDICNNHLYVSGYKSAISLNSEFYNNGTSNEFLSIIVKIDSDLDIINTIYFDEGTSNEKISSLNVSNSSIHLLLNTQNNILYFKLDSNLNLISKNVYNNDLNKYIILPNFKNNKNLLIADINSSLKIIENDSLNSKKVYESSVIGNIIDLKIVNGELLYYVSNKSNGTLYYLTEYEVIEQEKTILSYESYNTPLDNHFKAESYFEELEFKIDTSNPTTPYLESNMPGNYQINFTATSKNGRIIKETAPLSIERYTNFIDNGIYKVGFVLQFFGRCYINDEVVYYGTVLNTVGEYDITIFDVQGNEKNYHIFIVDNYYKQENNYTLDNFITTNVLEKVEYKINLDSNILVTGLIINQALYDDFTYDNFVLTINFYGESSPSIKNYYIEVINYTKDGVNNCFDIYKNVTVKTVKNLPIINIQRTIDIENFKIDLDITDYHKTFMYFKYYIYENNEIKNSFIVYNTTDKTISLSKNQTLIIDVLFNDNNNLYNETLCTYKATDSSILTKCSLNTTSGKLTNASIQVSVPDNYKDIELLTLSGLDMTNYYSSFEQYNFLGAIIIISVVLLVLVVAVYIFIKIVKNKRLKKGM